MYINFFLEIWVLEKCIKVCQTCGDKWHLLVNSHKFVYFISLSWAPFHLLTRIRYYIHDPTDALDTWPPTIVRPWRPLHPSGPLGRLGPFGPLGPFRPLGPLPAFVIILMPTFVVILKTTFVVALRTTRVIIDGHLGIILWSSGYQIGVIWVSKGGHLGIEWGSSGYEMGVI